MTRIWLIHAGFDMEKVRRNLLHKDTTDKIIKAFYYTYNRLGYGFLEKVYENALAITLKKMGARYLNRFRLKCILRVN